MSTKQNQNKFDDNRGDNNVDANNHEPYDKTDDILHNLSSTTLGRLRRRVLSHSLPEQQERFSRSRSGLRDIRCGVSLGSRNRQEPLPRQPRRSRRRLPF